MQRRTTNPLPGHDTMRSVNGSRTIFALAGSPKDHIGGIIDATYAYDGSNTDYETQLRPGCLMAQITSSKLWVPLKRSTLTDDVSTSATVPVTNAAFFKAGDTVTVGATAGKTIASVNYSTNVITLTSTVSASDGDTIKASGALAGAEIPRAILAEYVDLYDEETRTNRDSSTPDLCYLGTIRSAMVLGDLAEAVVAATLPATLLFDTDLGLT